MMSNPQSILKKTDRPSQKIVWDEAKLKQNKDQTKGQVFMKIDEPKTPFIRFEQTDKDLEELEDFSLGDSVQKPASVGFVEPKEWNETQAKEETEKSRHEQFEKKRAQHYFRDGDVFHKS